MRAAWYDRTGPAAEVLQVGELDEPRPGEGEVLVRVQASGVNPADVKLRSGWLQVREAMPRIVPHCDGAGVIEAVGPAVPRARIGERVWVNLAKESLAGTAAQYAVLDQSRAWPLPDAMSFAEGACIGVPLATAHHAVLVDGPVEGQTVLVAGGAGVVGHYAVQVATLSGARVIATVSSAEKAARARDGGADQTIDYKAEDVAERVMALTGGEGVDRIVEVDFGANVDIDARVIKAGGVIASYSSTSRPEPTLPYYPLALKGVTLRLVQAYVLPAERQRRMLDDMARWLGEGALTHSVGRRYGLDEIAAAHLAVETGAVAGRVVVEI